MLSSLLNENNLRSFAAKENIEKCGCGCRTLGKVKRRRVVMKNSQVEKKVTAYGTIIIDILLHGCSTRFSSTLKKVMFAAG